MDAIAVPSLGHHIKHCFSLDANDSPTVRSRHRSATPRTGALLGDVYMLDDLFFFCFPLYDLTRHNSRRMALGK